MGRKSYFSPLDPYATDLKNVYRAHLIETVKGIALRIVENQDNVMQERGRVKGGASPAGRGHNVRGFAKGSTVRSVPKCVNFVGILPVILWMDSVYRDVPRVIRDLSATKYVMLDFMAIIVKKSAASSARHHVTTIT
ncbi:uncharacterized protein LOC134279718 [Saccostrea cucullata]|uniref:uncharacterized protein LOC134279718 n=1 Tax=Saccostrea cuccullata TaxID=36930 RepID=UPI002ED162CC